MLPTKKCGKCGVEKPATSEYFRARKALKDGLSSWCKDCHKAYYEEHKPQILERQREYKAKNKEKIAERNRKYNQRTRAERSQKAKYKMRQLRQNDIFRLNECMSNAIYRSLRNKKAGRHWEELVGYTLEELMAHLEAQFRPGMSWANCGMFGWHIDHKKPKALFNYSTPDDVEFKKCWALENLQPLWAEENWSKGAREVSV